MEVYKWWKNSTADFIYLHFMRLTPPYQSFCPLCILCSQQNRAILVNLCLSYGVLNVSTMGLQLLYILLL